MSGNFKKDDLRIIRTRKYLLQALETLLERKSFRKITINDLCEEALISRTAFYSHFEDKYRLLQYWADNVLILSESKDLAKVMLDFMYGNAKKMRNILLDADELTVELFSSYCNQLLKPTLAPANQGDPEAIIYLQFCIGGLKQLLLWQIQNDFPHNSEYLKDYFKDMFNMLQAWQRQHFNSHK